MLSRLVGRIICTYWCILGRAFSNLRWCILWRTAEMLKQPEGLISQQHESDISPGNTYKTPLRDLIFHHLVCSHLELRRSLPTWHHSSLALFSLVFQYVGLGKCCCNHSQPLPSARNARWKHTSRHTAVMVQLSHWGYYLTVGVYWL